MNCRCLALAALALTACPQAAPVLVFEGGDVTGAVTWSGTVDVRTSFTVHGTLRLEPCTTVLLPAGGQVTVLEGGALIAAGTADCPVTLRSVKSSPLPGDWRRIEVYASASNDTRLTHTRVQHGDGTDYGVLWVEGRASVGLSEVTFEQSKGTSLQLEPEARLTTFSGVRFVNTADELVRVASGGVASLTPVTTSGVARPRVVVRDDLGGAATWKNLGVALQLSSLTVRGGALEVEAGTVLQLEPQAVLTVSEGGALRLLGTDAAPVVVESSKASPAPGDWRRIDVYASSQSDNLLRHVTVRHGGDTAYGVLWVEQGATVTLEQARFTANSSCEVSAYGTVNDTGSSFTPCP